MHWPILPLLLPCATGVLLIFMARAALWQQRLVSLLSAVLGIGVAIGLLIATAEGELLLYHLGNWPVPFGIVLVVDRFSALLVSMTAVLGALALSYGCRSDDRYGRTYHALFHFLLFGVQGAFVTGDLFNLFVFFEILLLASYGLLMIGAGPERTRASFHYVILNVAGSALFLLGLGVLYGVLGSLNLAHLAERVVLADPADLPLIRAGGLMMLMAFGLKAAMLPMYFWLPAAYSAAAPSVAALFAIMTKVGLYAIIRVHGLLFGTAESPLAADHLVWLWLLASGTLILALIGLLAARTLKRLVSYLVISSVGLVLLTLAIDHPPVLAGTLFYLVHSTFVVAGLYLLADLISQQRGSTRDYLTTAQPMGQPVLLGSLFLLGALSLAGMPPFSGFVSKLLIFQGSVSHPQAPWLWSFVLLSTLVAIIALSRAGSTLFWRVTPKPPARQRADGWQLAIASGTLLIGVLLSLAGEPVLRWTQAAATDLANPDRYIANVLGRAPVWHHAEVLTR